VQPQEPSTGQVPPAVEGPGSVAPPARTAPKRHRARLWVALIGGVLALLCLGGAGVVALLYNNATKIDRASPDQVASSFLRAYLIDRDDKEASLYTCKQPQLAEISALRSDMVGREQNYRTSVTASWESLTVTDADQHAKTAAVDLTIIGSKNGQQVSSHTESWTFGLVDQSGWRVCSATKLG
jgi:hypothetical protein